MTTYRQGDIITIKATVDFVSTSGFIHAALSGSRQISVDIRDVDTHTQSIKAGDIVRRTFCETERLPVIHATDTRVWVKHDGDDWLIHVSELVRVDEESREEHGNG